jgi:L-malate glycosyltransferase
LKKALRILILVPSAFPKISGNSITAERWRQALSRGGLPVRVVETEDLKPQELVEEIAEFQPDVVHAHHISRAGRLFLEPPVSDRCRGLPLVVSPAGTDLNSGSALSHDGADTVSRVLERASAIITQGVWTAQKVSEFYPLVRSRIAHVPKAWAWFGNEPLDLRTTSEWTSDNIIFFLPAGIRPVKGNLETLLAMSEIHALRDHTRIVFAGPVLDERYADLFQSRLAQMEGLARWIPAIQPSAMQSAYKSVDIVVNSSSSEGLSNALLEAIAAGRPTLASDIPGNRWSVCGDESGPLCGLLFDPGDREDFIRQALRLVDNRELRRRLGRRCESRASLWPTPEEEATRLLFVYSEAARLRQ